MAIFEHPEVFLILLGILLLCFLRIRTRKTGSSPTNWPVVGMLPGLLQNIHRVHDYITEILSECGGTFKFKGPLFSNMDMVLTSDPADIHHIFSKNFLNYPKGPEFRTIFEIFGDGIFNADFELWELHRRTTLSLFNQARFYNILEKTVWRKIETGLLPILDHFSEQGTVVDFQHILQRFSFDWICQLLLDYDPCSLSIDLPYHPCEKAFNEALEPLFRRHIVPRSIWKLQKWLKIGNEKKLIEAWKAFDNFIYPLISSRGEGEREESLNTLTAFRKAYEQSNHITFSGDLRKFQRDSLLSLMFAGQDTSTTTLTWLFWLLSANPSVENKICHEIETLFGDKKWRVFSAEESRKLVYLHAVLCETMRLFPPIGLELKSPCKPDTLPSGNHLNQNTKVIIASYSIGRMGSVWGKDCLEFRPERWISSGGGIKHVPSFKFPAFNVGPRTCLGKEMSLLQLKMLIATIIYRFQVQVVEDHPVSLRNSILLKPKQGLRVRFIKKLNLMHV
ncbi:Alkane hydroxylase MAH1 [Sesamum alatum]|uniref:Alkane hydroxylase MAH1 n=1 Tax=Sesamum alatum TaxID=300844 RepID=A0AAE2C9H7_9LAMI|nr:Alkane hydroxylase MAH1 [Sesamum alatum]